ncbi:unnamed protein product [Lepeophtheirus salmonis]|uniref:(salmon louse) hypothetical protein n=2 Tax=Lepeophtheirus salmonis TaxID=72036 RepID=A0A7R8CPV6_LEPSM|nr:unnamed protein product [Lepeophtheirus salmonis]CAF2889878.1 unnamed protein product [Lepeophtheirus salmonis]
MELNANSPFGPTSIAEEHMNGLSQTNEEDEEEEDEDRHHPSSSSDGRRSKLEVNVMNNHHATESVILTTPTSPRSVTTISMSASVRIAQCTELIEIYSPLQQGHMTYATRIAINNPIPVTACLDHLNLQSDPLIWIVDDLSRIKKIFPEMFFKGKLDFKSLLRREDPKEDERTLSGNRRRAPPPQRLEPQRGYIVDSDFDFRGGLDYYNSNPDMVNSFHSGTRNIVTLRNRNRSGFNKLNVDINHLALSPRNSKSFESVLKHSESTPVSPRRVGFADEIRFDFSEQCKSHPTSPSTEDYPRPILRVPLDRRLTEPLTISHANPDEREFQKEGSPPGDSLVQLYVPPSTSSSDIHPEFIALEPLRGISERKIPPPLVDCWSRSQSFPPPGSPSHPRPRSPIRKASLPEEADKKDIKKEDDMVEHENERLRDRVSDLEKRVHDQNDEITCLRATLADALRRINSLESDKGHVQVMSTSHPGVRLRRDENYNNSSSININSSITNGRSSGSLSGLRRPLSVSGAQYEFSPGGPRSSGSSMSHHESVNRRASYASNRERYGQRVLRRSALYQSTGSLHSDGHSSNSMSPAPSPSPTHNQIRSKNNNNSNINVKQFSTPSQRPHQSLIPQDVHHMSTHNHISNHNNNRSSSLSGSMTNLTNSKKWNSTSDFRDHSPGPNNVQRRMPSGSLLSLRSPFGSQQNLDRSHRHGTKDAVYNPDEGSVSMYVRGRPTQLFVPSSYSEYYSLSKVSPAPPQKLKLEWVYGYRGRDARSNLYLLPTGEMIYFVAAVVVLYNSEEQTQRHYLGHTEDVKCLAVHPNKLVIATGQSSGHDRRDGRPHVRVWNSVSMLTIHILGLGDFEKSICCVSFSKADGGNLLLAVEETSDHTISLWDWQRSDRGSKITETKCSNETVVAAEFHPLEGGSIVTCGKGHVNFWQLDSTGFTLSRKTGLFDQRDKPKYVTCLAFSYTGDLLTGDSNGNISVWGRGYNAVTKALRKVHNGPIFSICVLKDGSIVTGGGKDRRIVEFDSLYRRTGMEAELPEHMGSIRTISQGKGSQLLVGSTRNSILQGTFELSFHEIVTGHVDEIWALAVHPQQSQFLTADYESRIHLWDSLSHTSIWSSDTGEQAQSACFSNDGEVLLVGMVCGKWMVIDSRTREVYGLYQDGSEAIQTVRFSPDGKLLALGSRDNVIYVYQVSDDYKKYNRLGRCMGHSHFLTHLDWSADSTYIQSNSGDHELLYWNANLCRQISNPGDMRDTEWATQTCILSFNTIGVWPESIDGTDLVSASRSHNKKLLVTGDDVGKIKTFAYPVTQPKSLCHVNGGHSSQVTRLEFLSDDSRLISCGGRDTAIMQWIVSSH